MRKHQFIRASLVILVVTIAANPVVQAAEKGEVSKDSPGRLVVEEDWFVPFRYDMMYSLHDARVHYRRSEEKAAANQIRRAESWLKYAAGHARPITKESLKDAAIRLHKLAADLDKGELRHARDLDDAIAHANRAMAEWHYFNAKDHLGQDEEAWAAQDLQAAAQHLKAAAESARYEYGADLVSVIDDIDSFGDLIDEEVAVDPNVVADDLAKFEKELKKMSEALTKASAKK